MRANPISLWIAEDDEQLVEVLGLALTRQGRKIRLFSSGIAVLDALRDDRCDILLTDLVMPGADGIQILREVKESHPQIIVIIMTGYASIDTAIQAIRGGAYDYIRKPFKLDELEIVISRASEKISLLRENSALLDHLNAQRRETEELRSRSMEPLLNSSPESAQEKADDLSFILRQLNPASPDHERGVECLPASPRELLGALIGLAGQNAMARERLSSFKKILDGKK
jgi:DNA-binding NtrC family response regulator